VSDLGITLDHAEPLGVQRRGLSSGNRRMNQESLVVSLVLGVLRFILVEIVPSA